MEIRITFYGGPHDGRIAFTNELGGQKVFFTGDRRIAVYERYNEVEYHYSQEASDRLIDRYDDSLAWYSDPKNADHSTLRFGGAFSDRPIFGDTE